MTQLLKSLAISLIVFLAPLQSIIVSVLMLVIADMITGLLAARKAGDDITSGRMKRTISKLLIYYSAIIVSYVAATYLVDALIPVGKMVTTLIGVVELKSVLENLDIISGGDFFKSLVNKLSKDEDGN